MFRTQRTPELGRSVIAFAKQKGIRTINIVRRPELIQDLKQIGADVVPLAGPNAAAEVNRATGGALVRLALDGVGAQATGTLLDIVGWEAKIVCYAFPAREPITFNPFGMVAKRASINPFFMHYPDNLPVPEKIRSAAGWSPTTNFAYHVIAAVAVRRFG